MILVDTSVWVTHLRSGMPDVAALLDEGAVLCHPFVIGELACGDLANREETLRLVALLPRAPMASHTEVLELIERRALMGRGVGYVDVHLLASVALASDATVLWTRDRRLHAVAMDLGCAYGG